MISIAAVQFNPILRNVQANCATIKAHALSIDADVIVFPELSTCGYLQPDFNHSRAVARQLESEEMRELQEIATQRNRILVIGFAEADGQKVYNSAAVLMPDASRTRVYRKTHLFYKEKYCFNEGDTGFFVVRDDTRDLTLGVMICYDWRFPESARSLALQGADLIVCPSNLVTHIWRSVMPTRAIENKVYLVVANRWGSESEGDESLSFNGQSCIYSYNGEVLASAGAEGDGVLKATLEPSKTRDKSFNTENDIFKDRRPEYYLA